MPMTHFIQVSQLIFFPFMWSQFSQTKAKGVMSMSFLSKIYLRVKIRLLFLRLEKATPSLTWKKTIVRESLETLPDLAYAQQRAHFWKAWECGWPRRSWGFLSTFSLCSTAHSHFSGMCSFLSKLSLFLLLLMCLWCNSLSLDTRAWKLQWVSRD